LGAAEVMGEADCICTDKTGTLTENRMTVVKAFFSIDVNDLSIVELIGDELKYKNSTHKVIEKLSVPINAVNPSKSNLALDLPNSFLNVLTENIAVNSNCFLKYKEGEKLPTFVGSATEGALLVFSQRLGIGYENVRAKIRKLPNGELGFTSARKRMSTVGVQVGESIGTRLYCKGASEMVLKLCEYTMTGDAQKKPMTEKERADITGCINAWASEGLRTLVLGYKDLTDAEVSLLDSEETRESLESGLVFVGLVGIKDPVRKEVPKAVSNIKRAGFNVRMVTGDNILTASYIAEECGILFDDGLSIEGPAFRTFSEEDKLFVIPKMQVLARSSPADKFDLVKLLKKRGHVVGVTGDGTNDAPALKEADVNKYI
jgi:Ca2+-transporting ATPase